MAQRDGVEPASLPLSLGPHLASSPNLNKSQALRRVGPFASVDAVFQVLEADFLCPR